MAESEILSFVRENPELSEVTLSAGTYELCDGRTSTQLQTKTVHIQFADIPSTSRDVEQNFRIIRFLIIPPQGHL